MTKHNTRDLLSVALFTALSACSETEDAQTLRDKLAVGLTDATLPLADAIMIAETAGAGVAIEAELEVEHGVLVYSIDVVAADTVHRVDVDPVSGSVVRSRPKDTIDDDDREDAMFATDADWAALIAAAEARVSGEVFEMEVDDDVFEAKLLASDVIWEIEMTAAGEILKAETDIGYDGDDDGGFDEDDDDDDDDDTSDNTGDEDTEDTGDDDDDTGGDDDDDTGP